MRATTRLFRIASLATLVVATMSPFAFAGNPSVKFEFVNEPTWTKAGSNFETTVRVDGTPESSVVALEYAFAKEASATIEGKKDGQDPALYRFTVPVPENAASPLTYTAIANQVRSESRTIVVVVEHELDITGDAAIPLYYPLDGPEYTVRYVPCCNIFGGITTATRVPVNPEKSATGLPQKLLSDFLILSPDGLSASTMGMYMDFLLGPERFTGVTPALYEFNGREWVEYASYTVDATRGFLTMHCPNGGTFVIAAKP